MTMTFDDIKEGIKDGDHKMFVVPAGLDLTESIRKEMNDAGYVFAYAGPAADGSHEFYFVPLPTSRLTI